MTTGSHWHDPRTTDAIIASILANPDWDCDSYEHDMYWPNVGVICHRLTRDVLEAGIQLCASACSTEQRLGCDILCGLGAPNHPFREESFEPISSMLDRANNAETEESALYSLGHLRDQRAVPILLDYRHHPDEGFRSAVAWALPFFEDSPEVIPALIELSNDSDADVRDWATFGLGSQVYADSPALRAALWQRTDDSETIVRAEALSGLAQRKVPGTLEALLREVEREEVGYPVIEGAEDLGDPRCVAILERLRVRFPDWNDVTKALERARSA